ncbi:thermonuclease family protein [Pleurocapsa sp. PCC 7319]|uniref:thermonuclease family protein n=1 Tax=Pleurocapsa sp. PCC 7319 TaxID=118161 RepID=UPI0003453FD9|nr:thermonuclease family protein [Pleurocapsa sp. PCC 7319]
MNKIKLIIFGYCLTFLLSCTSDSGKINLLSATVTRVVSGQTIEVELAGTSEVTKVRIMGIDAPDLRQSPWGEAAQQRLAHLIMRSSIKLETDFSEIDQRSEQAPSSYGGVISDPYNRLQAHVWLEGNLISQRLVKEGYVLANTRYPHLYSKLLIDAQEYARLMGYGIWNPQQAMRYTPNQFRSNTK